MKLTITRLSPYPPVFYTDPLSPIVTSHVLGYSNVVDCVIFGPNLCLTQVESPLTLQRSSGRGAGSPDIPIRAGMGMCEVSGTVFQSGLVNERPLYYPIGKQTLSAFRYSSGSQSSLSKGTLSLEKDTGTAINRGVSISSERFNTGLMF